MTPASPVPAGIAFSAVSVGDRYSRVVVIEARHLDDGARLIGDFNPLHTDETFAQASRFGARILHGVITSALMGAELGEVFSGTAIAYLEHNARFVAPVFIGDRLDIVWTVTAREAKPGAGGGIVSCEGLATNQHGRVVCSASGRMLVGG